MEHKLILGGEQYLPFARSRLKALRAGGLEYATQKFVMPDGEVEIRIVGQQEYIRINGSDYDILSGVTKDGSIIGGDPDVLRSFKPTAETLKFILGDPEINADFHDEKRLAIEASTDLGVTGSQYTDICSSMYSGTMTKLAQIILGLGKSKRVKDGTQLRYDYRWAKCHGVLTGPDGKKWLVQISADGVYAMRVPIFKGSSGAGGSKQIAVREAVRLFGGVPSGAPFPSGAALTAAIEAGTVLELATASDMTPVYSKSSYSAALGWSFNDAGTEAHNTCHTLVSGLRTGYHYRLAITISAATPTPTGTATLQEVASGPLYGLSRFRFDSGDAGTPYANTPTTAWTGSEPNQQGATPIFATHINGVLEIVYHNYVVQPTTPTITYTPSGGCPVVPYTATGYNRAEVNTPALARDTFCSSTTNAGNFALTKVTTDYTTELTHAWGGQSGPPVTRTASDFQATSTNPVPHLFAAGITQGTPYIANSIRHTRTVTDTKVSSAGAMTIGCRDGYALRLNGNSITGGSSQVGVRESEINPRNYDWTVTAYTLVSPGLWDMQISVTQNPDLTNSGCPRWCPATDFFTPGSYAPAAMAAMVNAQPIGAYYGAPPPSPIGFSSSTDTPQLIADLTIDFANSSGKIVDRRVYSTTIIRDANYTDWTTDNSAFYLRNSRFGTLPHVLRSVDMATAAEFGGLTFDLTTVGAMLPPTTSPKYSFLGYI